MIGKTVYIFDMNRRVYHKPEPGRVYSSGPPIWREHWRPAKIVGETSRSWLLDWYKTKIPKGATNSLTFAWDEEAIARLEVVHEHRYRIGDAVQRCQDYETLVKVAALVGYELPAPK